MHPAIYDFKRSFLRILALLIIALVTTISTYLTASVFISNANTAFVYKSDYYDINMIGLTDTHYYPSNNSFVIQIEGYLFNNQGNPISGVVKVVVVHNTTHIVKEADVNGSFNITFVFPNLPSPYIQVTSTNSSIYVTNTNSSIIYYQPAEVIRILALSYNISVISNGYTRSQFELFLSNSTGSTMLTSNAYYSESSLASEIVFAQFGKTLILSRVNGTLHIIYYNNKTVVGRYNVPVIANRLEMINLNLPLRASNETLIFGNMSTSVVYYPYTELGSSLLNYYYYNVFPSITFLFPPFVIYLAYSSFSRPRDNGALEFILSRPVTKDELYINRFTANSLTIALASLIFVLAFIGTVYYYSQITFPFFVVILNSVGLFILLSTYLSLAYLVGALFKSSNWTILITTLAYLINSYILPLIPFVKPNLSFITYYMGFGSVNYFIRHYIFMEATKYDPMISTFASVGWIAIPFLLGVTAFRKRDI